ncbi:hypothetical protein JL720_16318 [Aureococcus anophagefferens]|nr:hypothetical protein JL720_16318 [Aureococcus anophagefferens]
MLRVWRLVFAVASCAALAPHTRPQPTPLPSRTPFARALSSAVALVLCASPTAAPADVGDILAGAVRANEITYSQNGKNLQRMGAGDYTMGTKLTSTEPRALKRRARRRRKSSKVLAKLGAADEKACTVRVLDGDVASVIGALDALGDECKVDATHMFRVANIGLCVFMCATAIDSLSNESSESDTDAIFVALYVFLFAVMLFVFEAMSFLPKPIAYVDAVYRANFGFMYKPVTAPSSSPSSVLQFGLDSSHSNALGLSCGILTISSGILMAVVYCKDTSIFDAGRKVHAAGDPARRVRPGVRLGL